jgi:hypothetical protein
VTDAIGPVSPGAQRYEQGTSLRPGGEQVKDKDNPGCEFFSRCGEPEQFRFQN